jgi:hypothetical protein
LLAWESNGVDNNAQRQHRVKCVETHLQGGMVVELVERKSNANRANRILSLG